MRRSTSNGYGERKTMAVCDCHDLGALADSSIANTGAPFFALANEPSMKASLISKPPRSRKSSATVWSIRSITPSRTHFWKRRWQVWYGGYRSGTSFHGAPVRSTHRMPFSTSRLLRQGRPRPSDRRCSRGNNGSMISHCSFIRSMPVLSAGLKSIPQPFMRWLLIVSRVLRK
jgi:hypothetical protein